MARPDITELGESLLSGKIERVRKQEKRAEKDQRKALLMGLGLQLGAGAVQSFFDKKVQDFSQNEKILASKVKINSIRDQQVEWKGIKEQVVKSNMAQEDYFITQTKSALYRQHNYEKLKERLSPSKLQEFEKMIEQQSRTKGLERSALFDTAGKELAEVVDADSFDAMVEKLNSRPKNIVQAGGNWLRKMFTGQDVQAEKEEVALEKLYRMGYIEANEFDVAMKQFRKHGTMEAANAAANLVQEEGTTVTTGLEISETSMIKEQKIWTKDGPTVVRLKVDFDDPKANQKAIDAILVENIQHIFKNSLSVEGKAEWNKIVGESRDLTKDPEMLSVLAEKMTALLSNDAYIDKGKSQSNGLEYQRVLQSFSAILSSRENIYMYEPERLIQELPLIWDKVLKNDLASLQIGLDGDTSNNQNPLGRKRDSRVTGLREVE